uniref:Retrovirus-related Pol polyprotein from transposon TNT 1-94 n=1 Tax=Cajanus cajan TaxID=3821 RepID=A0A151TTK7_CAJCA|nr:Retrovirus-related Pol polyprotein from transposon TNT 1-94 [Cajanus cajan]
MHTLGINPPDANWYMDIGPTSHMTSAQGNLTYYFNMSNKHGIIVGNSHSIPIHDYGHTKLSFPCLPLTLNNVLHAPQLVKNLVSVRKFTTINFISVEFDPFGFFVKDFQMGKLVMRCESRGELYPIIKPTNSYTFATVAPSLWHDRLGHPGSPVLTSLRKNKLIKYNQIKVSRICHSCPLGKHVKLSFYASNSCTIMPFDIFHSDLWTSLVLSSSGHRYYVLFVDDYSKFLWIFPLSQKSQTYSTFLNFKSLIRTQFERDIKNIQCDNDTEFDNGPFWEFCKANGVFFIFHVLIHPLKMGNLKDIRTINNIVCTLLAHASFPPSFWHHALQMATYLLNILPHKLLNYQSPLQILYQKDPSYSHLRVFGCLCYPLIPSTTINKLQPWSTSCIFLGYPLNHCGYKCFDLSS